MQIFFSSLEALDRFSFSLNSFSNNACQHCHAKDQWVSHGYVYKKNSRLKPDIVGKRIMCSNRHHKNGCGRTRQLYVQSFIPRKHYNLFTLALFISTLLQGTSVVRSYRNAISSQCDARHAWRWISQLFYQLGRFRVWLNNIDSLSFVQRSSRRLNILLSTLQPLLPFMNAPINIQSLQHCAFC